MKNQIDIKKTNSVLSTTSKVIADVFGKPHRNVMRDIDSLGCSDEFSTLNFEQSDYSTERGKTYKCYNITEKGFYMLAMGFTGKKATEWKEAFINEFDRLRTSASTLDDRMNEAVTERKNLILDGQSWSQAGRNIKDRKRLIEQKEKALLSEVQISLGFEV